MTPSSWACSRASAAFRPRRATVRKNSPERGPLLSAEERNSAARASTTVLIACCRFAPDAALFAPCPGGARREECGVRSEAAAGDQYGGRRTRGRVPFLGAQQGAALGRVLPHGRPPGPEGRGGPGARPRAGRHSP